MVKDARFPSYFEMHDGKKVAPVFGDEDLTQYRTSQLRTLYLASLVASQTSVISTLHIGRRHASCTMYHWMQE